MSKNIQTRVEPDDQHYQKARKGNTVGKLGLGPDAGETYRDICPVMQESHWSSYHLIGKIAEAE